MTTTELIPRLRAHLTLKVLLGIGLCAMFALLYRIPQQFPLFPGTAMKQLWLDRLVPFTPDAVYLYESLYLLMPIAPWLMTSRKSLLRYSLGLVLMSGVGFCFFYFCPTLSPRPLDAQKTNRLYQALIAFDNEFNAFPSLHVAYAVFHSACCYALFQAPPQRHLFPWLFWIWTFGIALSTMLTKQHVFADVLAGAILGFASYRICCQPDKRPRTHWRQT